MTEEAWRQAVTLELEEALKEASESGWGDLASHYQGVQAGLKQAIEIVNGQPRYSYDEDPETSRRLSS